MFVNVVNKFLSLSLSLVRTVGCFSGVILGSSKSIFIEMGHEVFLWPFSFYR